MQSISYNWLIYYCGPLVLKEGIWEMEAEYMQSIPFMPDTLDLIPEGTAFQNMPGLIHKLKGILCVSMWTGYFLLNTCIEFA